MKPLKLFPLLVVLFFLSSFEPASSVNQEMFLNDNGKADKVVKYLKQAEYYHKMGKENDAEIDIIKKEIRTQKGITQKIVSQYNKAFKAENEERAKELKPQMDKALAKIKALEEALPSNKPSIKNYKKEAKFRKKALKFIAENKRKSEDYYKLGVAFYKSEKYEKAETNLTLALKDNSKPLNILQYLMQTAYYREQEDIRSNEWLARGPSEKVINTFGSKNLEELEEKEKQLLLVAYEIQVFYNFNPTGEDANYHCDEAKPWMDKIYAINPNHVRIKAVADYCNQTKN